MIGSMFFVNGDGVKLLQNFDIIKVLILISLLFICHYLMRNSSLKELSLKTPAWLLGIGWAVMLFLIVISQGSGQQFIYFQF